MENKLSGKKVAALMANGFEQVEFIKPANALKYAGAQVYIISSEAKVNAWDFNDWGEEFKTDVLLNEAHHEDFDALLLPGGVMNPDKLRMNKRAIQFISSFMNSGKPIAAICHAPWVLIETGMVKGRKLTSYPSLKTDLINAGAKWEDKEVVVDNGLITSRKPDDIPAFSRKLMEEIIEGKHVFR
ncbi:MAG: type 1 glutamine amidotransferase domain-containing protein [Cytophagaceae bacterium]